MTLSSAYKWHFPLGGTRLSEYWIQSDDGSVQKLGPAADARQEDLELYEQDPIEWAKSVLRRNKHPDSCRLRFSDENGTPTIRVMFASNDEAWTDRKVRKAALETLCQVVQEHR